ncbi:MAG: ABC transporter substrate-binding protein [Clostridia bacterium]
MTQTGNKIVCMALCFAICLTIVGCAGDTLKGQNKDNSFATISSWTTNGLLNHYNSNTSCGAFDFFVVEGLYIYVRSTDEIYDLLAEGKPVHTEEKIDDFKEIIGEDALAYYKVDQGYEQIGVTTVKIKEKASWQNGEDFTAKDIWSYYYIMHPTSSNYMVGVKVVDSKTVQFLWNPIKEPENTVKELLIAQDKSGTVKYDEFSAFVDKVHSIVMASPINKKTSLWGAFNRFSTNEQILEMNVTRNAFFQTNPSWYIDTGPFKMETFSPTQILLVKNEFYWNADKIGFDKIKIYSSNDLNQTYQLLTNGMLDYYDGFIQQDTLQSMLDTNKNLVNIKMYDPGAIGLIFNLENPLFTLNVRKAFQYIFDRDEIKNAGNPYAQTSWYPILGMAPSEAETYMDSTYYNKLPKYRKDTDEASKLLTAEGWTKNNGYWFDKEGKQVVLDLGAPVEHDISSVAAEATQAQLEAFGIKVNLLKSSNFWANAPSDNCPYDIMLTWTDLNMTFSFPTGSYNQFSAYYSKFIHLERYPNDYVDSQKAGSVKMTFDGLGSDTKKYEFADYINSFYSLGGKELEYLVSVFNTGIAEQSLGIQFFQNVTCSTINVGRIEGVPLKEYWSKDSNVTYIPSIGSKDFFDVAKTNLVFAGGYYLLSGIYQPNK